MKHPIFAALAACVTAGVLLLSAAAAAYADTPSADASVVYHGHQAAQTFTFAVGEPLFPNFHGLMPGDRTNGRFTVRNESSHTVEVWLKLDNPKQVEFLNQLRVCVQNSADGALLVPETPVGQVNTGFVRIGSLAAHAQTTLTAQLAVPETMSNAYQNASGSLDWTFQVTEQEDAAVPVVPIVPATGGAAHSALYILTAGASLGVMVCCVFRMRKLLRRSAR